MLVLFTTVGSMIFPAHGKEIKKDLQPPDLPLLFVENQGQWPASVQFSVRAQTMVAAFEKQSIHLYIPKHPGRLSPEGNLLRLTFENALRDVNVMGETPQATRCGFFLGNDASKWRSGVPTYAGIRYHHLYDGIDVGLRSGIASPNLEYDLCLTPGSDPGKIVIRCDGAEQLALSPDGTLLIKTQQGELRQPPPATWQLTEAGDRQPIECRYRLLDERRYGFELVSANPQWATVIDPELVWATYLGEGNYDVGEALAVAPDGSVLVTGFTLVLGPPFDDIDTFVARFSEDGTALLNLSFLDGGNIDGAFGISSDLSGIVTVAGQTFSSGFPITDNAFQKEFGGFSDGYLVQLSPDLQTLLYSSFYGGSGEEAFTDMAVDKAGGFVMCGYTGSDDLPVTSGAYQENFGGGVLDAFVARIVPANAPSEQLTYATYVGGSADDSDFDPADPFGSSLDERLLRQAVAVTPSGKIVVAGMTWSEDFPVTSNALQSQHSAPTGIYPEDADMYLTVLNPAAAGQSARELQLVYSTYLGGSMRDVSEDLVAHDNAKVTLVGISRSADFMVTANAYQSQLKGSQDAVIVQMKPIPAMSPRAQLSYASYLGGSGRDSAQGVHPLVSGDIVVGGVCGSEDFPTTDGSTLNGPYDLFLTRLDTSRNSEDQLIGSTLFGGSGSELLCVGPVGDGMGTVYITGDTDSADLPGVEGSYDDTFGGGVFDAFVARFHVGSLGNPKD